MLSYINRHVTHAIKHRAYLVLSILACAGLTIRLLDIGRMNFFYDEVLLWEYSLTGYPLYTPTEPPLMAWLLYVVMSWVQSANAFIFHLVPVVLGALVVLSAFLVAEQASGSPHAGLLAALLITLSPMAIHYSQEGRPYALFMLISSAIYASFIWATKANRPIAWGAYTLFLFLGGLSHLLITQIAVVVGLFSLARLVLPRLSGEGRDLRVQHFMRFLVCSGTGGVSGTLWFVHRYFTDPAIQANRQSIFQSGMYEYGVLNFLRDALRNLGAGPFGSRVDTRAFGIADFLALLFLSFFVLGLWRLYKQDREGVALLCALAVVVPLVINYLSLGGKGNWDWMRWISHLVVPYVVVIAIGIQFILQLVNSPYAQVLLCVGLVGSLIPGTVSLPARPDYQSNRDIANYLEQNVAQLKGVLILPARPDIPSPADNRILDIYYYLKHETLPVYLLSFGKIRRPVLEPSRDHITRVPRELDDWEMTPESGKYAVLSRLPFEDCAKVPPWLRDVKAVSRQSAPIVRGLTVCEFDFSTTPVF